ncbi:protein PSK SIMULATOR 1-like isoform X2 [Carex rostrata]
MGGVCSSANPLDRTPSELSFRAFQLVEDLKPFTYTKPPNRRNVTPIDEIVETETEPRQTSLSENKHQNPETMAPKEVQKMKGVTVNSTATKNSGSSKTSGGNIVGRVSNAGFGKAVEGFDLIVSGMVNLTPSTGFASGSTAKGTVICILAFEVANTIVKGANLINSLSKENIKYLKEVVFNSDGVQRLVSSDAGELERLVEADKRRELNVFASEIVRFGNRCKDRQWHNLDRYFSKLDSEVMPQKQLKETARAEMQYLLNLVKNTAELYHEMHSLDKFQQEFKQRRKDVSLADYERDTMQIIEQELKNQKKHVKRLQKKSLWFKMLEEVIEKLVDVVHFLHLEIGRVFDVPAGELENGSTNSRQSLGSAGLCLHYANIITQIDVMVSLPLLRTSIDNSLQWLVPMANNTTRAHHGFGWVGEWANTGGEVRRSNGPVQTEVIRIETLYHADKVKTDAYILDLLTWLHHLISQTRPLNGGNRSPSKSPVRSPPKIKQLTLSLEPQNTESSSSNANSTRENPEKKVCKIVSNLTKYRGLSKSQEFERRCNLKLRKNDRLSKSTGNWLPPVVDLEAERIRVLDMMDRVDFARNI